MPRPTNITETLVEVTSRKGDGDQLAIVHTTFTRLPRFLSVAVARLQ
jgi:hypothetical protein